jgi:hypothetical protein
MHELVRRHPRFGYRRIWAMLPKAGESIASGSGDSGSRKAFACQPKRTRNGDWATATVSAAQTFQLPTFLARMKPKWMSVSRTMPRHRTMLPGGESCVRFRYPPSRASRVRKSPTVFFPESLFAGTRCYSSLTSVLVKTSLAGRSGDTRLTIVSHSTRQARMHRIAIRLASRSALRSLESSARQPDLRTL